MVQALAYRGPDGVGQHAGGAVAMAHLALHTTAESRREGQPLVPAGDRLILVADARIDNRAELIESLSERDLVQQSDPTDAELILAAYRAWGEDCPRHLLGDFAFALWDGHRSKLVCARDPLGIRMLCYARLGPELVFATTVGGVLAGLTPHPSVHLDLLRELIAKEYRRWVHETAWQGVLRLPPGYALIASGGGVELRRFWQLSPHPEAGLSSDDDYFQRFRELLGEALRCRMRSETPPALLVSGGLDSSSLACLAQRLSSNGPSAAVRLYSFVFERTPSADEREYLDAVEESCFSLALRRVVADDFWALREFGADRGFPFDEPEIEATRSHFSELLRSVAGDGARVAITGIGADQIMGADAYHAVRGLADVPAARLKKELPYFRLESRGSKARSVALSRLARWLPEGVLSWRSPSRFGGSDPFSTGALDPPSWDPWLVPPPLPNSMAWLCHHAISGGFSQAAMANQDLIGGWLGVEQNYPYLDRRVVEFLLALPADLRFREGWNKFLLRGAMKGILPLKVQLRRGGAYLGDLEARGFRERECARVENLLGASFAEKLGWIPAGRAREVWRSYQQHHATKGLNRRLTVLLCAEAWLQHVGVHLVGHDALKAG